MKFFKRLNSYKFGIWDKRSGEVDPDEIFLDSSNLPQFDVYQFEGRLEQPISKKTIFILGLIFFITASLFVSRLWLLQIKRGEAYASRSEQNHLREIDIFSNRGVIYDSNGIVLADNSKNEESQDFAKRVYANYRGLAHVLGYVKYPTKDSAGFYFRDSFLGEAGVEKTYNETLSGKNGVKIVETDALGNIQSQSVTRESKDGSNLNLTVDAKINNKLYEIISQTSAEHHFTGGAGVIMNVHNGKILALVSFPEYDSNVVTAGKNAELKVYQTSSQTPFLNRVISGLYTPGSIIKPIIATAALEEKIIGPNKQILSTGSISLPNPYFPDKFSVFKDWKAHGWIDIRHALAVSSDVYFYEIGGGFEKQKGLGITKIEKYLRLFGVGELTGIDLPNEKFGTIPNPEWKLEKFNDDPWRIGDTYNTSIGQYGVQITPLEVVRAIAAIANGGNLVRPNVVNGSSVKETTPLSLNNDNLQIVREGMRLAVTEGTAIGLNVPNVEIAGKTGTAELGTLKQYVNSWSTGFFPYQNPKYAFALIMEKGPRANTTGATFVMRTLIDWMTINTPEYLQSSSN